MLTQTIAERQSGQSLFWPLLLSFWIAASFASFRQREVWELWGGHGLDVQVQFQIGSWLAFGLLALWLLVTSRADLRLLQSGPLLWYCGFVLLALVSTVYSVSPALTLFRSLQLAIAVILVISLREHLPRLYTFIAFYVAINWALFLIGWFGLDGGVGWLRGPEDLYVAFNGTAHEAWRLWTAFGHPSQIAVVAGIAAVAFAARAQGRQWLIFGPLVAWLLLTVCLTVSRTAILATFAALALIACGRRMLLPFAAIVSTLLFAAFASPDAQEQLAKFLMRGQSSVELNSLTGRIWVYQSSLDQVAGNWLLGNGFRASRMALLDQQAPGQGAVHSHNLILEALNGLGVIGAALVVMVLASFVGVVLALLRLPPPEPVSRWELPAVLVLVCGFCALDSGYAFEVNPFVMTFLAVLALAQTTYLDRPSPPLQVLDEREDNEADAQTVPSGVWP